MGRGFWLHFYTEFDPGRRTLSVNPLIISTSLASFTARNWQPWVQPCAMDERRDNLTIPDYLSAWPRGAGEGTPRIATDSYALLV